MFVEKRLDDFAAGHRLIYGYEGKCKNLHGHNYSVIIRFSSKTTNSYGFVVDFGDIKKLCNTWVKENWDHATILPEDDYPLLEFLQENKQRFYLLPTGINPTAENLASHLFNILNKLVTQDSNFKGVTLVSVKIYETERSFAEYKPEN